MTKTKAILAAIILASAGLGASAASATTAYQAHHPRRAEVNARLAHENMRINRELRAGAISPRQAHILHSKVHAICKQEQVFAASHNGHITRHQQHVLNREENALSGQIIR